MYRLLFEDRTLSREPYVTREPSVLIGRDEDCALQIVGGGVSGRHAAIERRADGYHVRDLGGVNGVRVNGQTVGDQRLSSGDQLELGAVRLRFEIVHELPGHRRSFDLVQLVAGMFVALLILGQLLLLYRIVSEPRSRQVHTDNKPTPPRSPAALSSPSNAAAPRAATEPLRPLDAAANQTTPASNPAVLNHMLRIARVDRKEDADSVTLQIQVKAQVGERELDATTVAIGVQFITPTETKTLWMETPEKWENFTTKLFSARYSGSPRQLQGYIVRTYYRKQLQDAVALPPGLLMTAPVPTP